MRQVYLVPLMLVLSLSLASPAAAQAGPAIPVDPVDGILDAFATHDIVALGDGAFHGDLKSHAFQLTLFRDPRFASAVNDIVLEAYNARYQEAVDRFVQGEDVPYETLKRAWQDSTQVAPGVDAPMRQQTLVAIRDINRALPAERKIRVLLGDPPIDWDQIHRREDLATPLRERDIFAAEVIRTQVLARKRRALLIYGGIHLLRKSIIDNFADTSQSILVPLLAQTTNARLFNVWVAADLDKQDPQIAAWPVPSLTLIRGTALGVVPFTTFYPAELARLESDGKGGRTVVPKDRWRAPPPMEQQFDALLHIGPLASIPRYRLARRDCDDPEYLRTKLERMRISGYPNYEAVMKERCETAE